MISLSDKSNLLENEPHRYTLHDVTEPELYRDMFPYDEVPKTTFNFRVSPVNMPEEIWITDTTFRDGQQSRVPYTKKQIVDLYKLLARLGGPKGIIRQTEFFVYDQNDRAALEECMELGYSFPELTTWIRATKEDFKLVKDIGIKETGILVSCSDYHIFKKLGKTRSEVMKQYLETISQAFEAGIIPRCHLEDVTRADFYGFVVPFVNKLMAMSKDAGIPVKIRVCDTMGYGLPYQGIALPRSVPGIIYGLQHYSNVPSEALEWHGHNDFYKGVANATCAWLFGACAVNCSLLGIGERTGNIPLEAMVMEYATLRGTIDGMDTTAITDIARYYRKEIGYKIPPMTPFVGRNFNVTRAGIHADGLMKDEEIYNVFNTKLLLNRDAEVAISNTSGLAGIAFWINSYYELEAEFKITKKDKLVQQLRDWVNEQYATGRQTIISDEELDEQTQIYAAGRFSRV